jgi:hypothetical protein
MRRRQVLVVSIVVLAAAQCLLWLVAASFAWSFRYFLIGNDQQVLADRTRGALALFAWFAINTSCLVAYSVRSRGWGLWLLAAVQSVNLGITLWFGVGQVNQTCGQHGYEWFLFTGLAAMTLLLSYVLWRRVDRSTHAGAMRAAARQPFTRLWSLIPAGKGLASLALIVVLIAVSAALIGLGWNFSIQGIQMHAGIVRTVQLERGTISTSHVTIDSSTHDYAFDDLIYDSLPDVRLGDQVVILTSESCGYGSTVALQSKRGIWFNSINDFGVKPFTPENWPIHELIQWVALSLGPVLGLFGVTILFRWIG